MWVLYWIYKNTRRDNKLFCLLCNLKCEEPDCTDRVPGYSIYKTQITNLKIWSLHLELRSPLQRIWNPPSPRLLLLFRSSSIRELDDFRTVARILTEPTMSPQPVSLQENVLCYITELSTNIHRSHSLTTCNGQFFCTIAIFLIYKKNILHLTFPDIISLIIHIVTSNWPDTALIPTGCIAFISCHVHVFYSLHQLQHLAGYRWWYIYGFPFSQLC